MSILSRLLKREEEASAPASGPTSVPPGATPEAAFPESAEQTDANQLAGSDEAQEVAAEDVVIEAEAPAIATAVPAITPAGMDEAFRKLAAAAAASPEADMAALRTTFEELAVFQVAPLRNLMIEIRWGEAQPRWIELCRPALETLRDMARQVELPDMVTALEQFLGALAEAARAGGNSISAPVRQALLAAYQPLCTRLDKAFAIDGERDRREPLIVDSLMQQMQGLDPQLQAKLTAVGLHRLENLLKTDAEEIALVAGLSPAVAAAVVEQVNEFRRTAPVALSSDPEAARRPLEPLLGHLDAQHQSFERAAGGWSEQDISAKRSARRERDRAWLVLLAALARPGEVDLALAAGRLPYGRRIEELQRFLRQGAAPPAVSGSKKTPHTGGTGDGRAHA